MAAGGIPFQESSKHNPVLSSLPSLQPPDPQPLLWILNPFNVVLLHAVHILLYSKL